MKFMDRCAHTVETVDRRFSSANGVSAESVRITEEEWRNILEMIYVLQQTCDDAGVRPVIREATIQ